MDRGKDPFFLLCNFTPFGSTLGLLLHLQYYQRYEPIILKMWVKSKFVLWQPLYFDLLTAKNNKKLTFWSTFFWELAGTVSLKKFFSNTILRSCAFGNFTLPDSIILVKDLIRWKTGFEIFLTDYYADDIGNKNIAGKY